MICSKPYALFQTSFRALLKVLSNIIINKQHAGGSYFFGPLGYRIILDVDVAFLRCRRRHKCSDCFTHSVTNENKIFNDDDFQNSFRKLNIFSNCNDLTVEFGKPFPVEQKDDDDDSNDDENCQSNSNGNADCF